MVLSRTTRPEVTGSVLDANAPAEVDGVVRVRSHGAGAGLVPEEEGLLRCEGGNRDRIRAPDHRRDRVTGVVHVVEHSPLLLVQEEPYQGDRPSERIAQRRVDPHVATRPREHLADRMDRPYTEPDRSRAVASGRKRGTQCG